MKATDRKTTMNDEKDNADTDNRTERRNSHPCNDGRKVIKIMEQTQKKRGGKRWELKLRMVWQLRGNEIIK